MLEPVRPGAVSRDRALCLSPFSHFLIVNKTSLSLSGVLHLALNENIGEKNLSLSVVLHLALKENIGTGTHFAVDSSFAGWSLGFRV